jgi:phosphoribosylformylglycinamidine synthase subunit PurSL
VTAFQIEVRASAERHDVHAHKLAHNMLQLPAKALPSLSALPPDPPLFIRTSQLFRLSGHLSTSQLDQLTHTLLIDPITQEACISSTTEEEREVTHERQAHIVDVFFHAGVTDTLAESVLGGAHMLGVEGLEHVETGKRYYLDARLSTDDAHTIARTLLYNPVIQTYRFSTAGDVYQSVPEEQLLEEDERTFTEDTQTSHVTTIPLTMMSDEQLLETSKSGMLALNLAEMQAIQRYYREQEREPTDVELETLAQTWSEHCSHKTFKATINYREVDAQGNEISSETIAGLLKTYIMRATEEIQAPWLVSAFSDNAGIIRFTETYDAAFKVETHNHPSAIEPFGGANTGVGGVIRDVVGVSAQPIACTDVLCFGPRGTPMDELSSGILPPDRIAAGVVDGIRDYGNKMGIPTVNGAILYHPRYLYNPLVFCGCAGLLPHGSHARQVQPGDLIVALGGRTGRDGIHGATFSSGEMSSELNARAGSAVQIGAPITEKKVTDVIMQARDRKLYHAITDCGAGGFSSAIGEMGEETGARVELAHAPLKYQGLTPWEIWLSEAQERMVLAVPPRHIDELLSLCEIEEVEASVLGSFSDDKHLIVTYYGQVVANLDMRFLHKGNPHRTLHAVWKHPSTSQAGATSIGDTLSRALNLSFEPTLLSLLRHPDIASKEAVVRRYDHEVQGATVLKPLVGRAGNGPGDAAVLQPILDEPAMQGLVISNGLNPLYGRIDPYHMALNAVDEALRNLTAVGGDIEHAAILDNFCWGSPADPVQLGLLVRAVKGCYDAAVGFGTPFISGKDSLNNEYRSPDGRLPVLPTLLISAIGVVDDAARTVDMALKTPGNQLYLIGPTRNELAGSHYTEVIDPDSFSQLFKHSSVPRVQVQKARATMKALGEAIRRGYVKACHDLSEGGLAVAAAEMTLAAMLGIDIDVSKLKLEDATAIPAQALNIVKLFSESPSRFLVEVAPEQWGAFEKHMRTHTIEDITYLGSVTTSTRFIVRDDDNELINVDVAELQAAWKGDLP